MISCIPLTTRSSFFTLLLSFPFIYKKKFFPRLIYFLFQNFIFSASYLYPHLFKTYEDPPSRNEIHNFLWHATQSLEDFHAKRKYLPLHHANSHNRQASRAEMIITVKRFMRFVTIMDCLSFGTPAGLSFSKLGSVKREAKFHVYTFLRIWETWVLWFAAPRWYTAVR